MTTVGLVSLNFGLLAEYTWPLSHELSFSHTTHQLVFVCEKFSQRSREPHCREYFSLRTNIHHMVVIKHVQTSLLQVHQEMVHRNICIHENHSENKKLQTLKRSCLVFWILLGIFIDHSIIKIQYNEQF